MKKPPKPDPNEFARQVLAHLCGLRAHMAISLQMLSRLIEPDVNKANEICRRWIEDSLEIQKKYYFEALRDAGIPPSKDEGPESSA
jgi:hypothetical protein